MWLARKRAGAASAESTADVKQPRVLSRRHTPVGAPPLAALDASLFKAGAEDSCLDGFVRSGIYSLVVAAGRPGGDRSLRVASFCTGSASDFVALDSIAKHCRTQGIRLDFDWQFFVEINQAKRAWISKVLAAKRACACIFDDATKVATNKRKCFVHDDACDIPDTLDLLIGGFSCKDFSRARTSQRQQGASALSSAVSPGGTAQTFWGIIDFIKLCSVEIVILENVDDITDKLHDKGYNEIMSALGQMNYDVHTWVMNAADYGLPQSRTRAFIVGITRPSTKYCIPNYGALMVSITKYLKMVVIEPPSLEEILLDESDPLVRNELRRLLAKGEPKGFDQSTLITHCSQWQKLGLRMNMIRPRSQTTESNWFQTLCSRERDIIAYRQHVVGGKKAKGEFTNEQRARLMGTDVNNSISMPAGTTLAASGECVLAPTVMPSMKFWLSILPLTTIKETELEARDRLMLGYESMLLQGWPVNHVDFDEIARGESNHFLQDLSGNALPSTCLAALVLSITFALIDNDVEVASCSSADVKDAVKLLTRSTARSSS